MDGGAAERRKRRRRARRELHRRARASSARRSAALLLVTCAITVRARPRAAAARQMPSRNGLRVTRPFVDLFISRALVYVGFYTLLGYLLFYVQDVLGVVDARRRATRQTGILIVTFHARRCARRRARGAAERPARQTARRDDRRRGAFIVALAVFIASHSTAGCGAATWSPAWAGASFSVADWAIACRVLPTGAMAAAMGIWNLAIVVPQIVAPALTTARARRASAERQPARRPRVAFGLALA